jgi:hypothetical protein
VTKLEGSKVRVGKKNTQKLKKRVKGQQPKKVEWYNVELTQGQEPDEETHPILWTEPSNWCTGGWVLVHSSREVRLGGTNKKIQ